MAPRTELYFFLPWSSSAPSTFLPQQPASAKTQTFDIDSVLAYALLTGRPKYQLAVAQMHPGALMREPSVKTHLTDPIACMAPGEHSRLRQLVGVMTQAAACARAPFEWADGPLVTAMRQGDIILIDELNLAEDAVLERLNRSVQSHHRIMVHLLPHTCKQLVDCMGLVPACAACSADVDSSAGELVCVSVHHPPHIWCM